MNKDNPAYIMSMKSRGFVANHDKENWLAMFAEDGVIEDPIGPSPIDPAGKGYSTPETRSAFWDNGIANSEVEYILHASHTSHMECANIVTLNLVISMDGKRFSQQVNGIFTYHCNEEGKLAALRGYWEFDESMATFKELTSS